MKKKSKIITTTLISIIAAVLCTTIVIATITHHNWFSNSGFTNSTIVSEVVETVIVEQTASNETTTSKTETEPQENSSQQPTSQPAAPSNPTPPTSSNNSTCTTSSGNNKNQVYHPISGLPFKQLADPETGISWDGVSPIIYTYEDGTTGTEKRENARYEQIPGMWTEVVTIPHGDGVFDPHCDDCGKLMGDGTNGTCISHWIGGDWVHELCGATIPVDTCHTCGVPVVIEPLPGVAINSPDQLTDAHKEYLYECAAHIVKNNVDARDNPKLVAVYSFILTDNTALSTRSKCVCFFVYSVQYWGREDTVYHAGEMFDMYINEREKLRYTASLGSTWYTGEADAVADYQKVGTNITKIG